MLDRQALAHQAKFGGSYEQAFTKIYKRRRLIRPKITSAPPKGRPGLVPRTRKFTRKRLISVERIRGIVTRVHTDPANAEIRDLARYDHIAKAHDAMHARRDQMRHHSEREKLRGHALASSTSSHDPGDFDREDEDEDDDHGDVDHYCYAFIVQLGLGLISLPRFRL
jgi:hypothetical protein